MFFIALSKPLAYFQTVYLFFFQIFLNLVRCPHFFICVLIKRPGASLTPLVLGNSGITPFAFLALTIRAVLPASKNICARTFFSSLMDNFQL
ncbi:hypothetical protein CW304_13875 [Bacillus sp. UFRGS-B20]|nr:hypothetical protein CW304_13875 [Bacillus sp. UFRGS-B20]